MDFTTFLVSTMVLGFLEAAPLLLAAIGFTLIFRLNGFINVAYAETITIGAYFGVLFNNYLGWNLYVSLIPAGIFSGIFSVITYLVFYRPALKRGVRGSEMIILSVGVSYFLRYLIRIVFGNDLLSFKSSVKYFKIMGVGVTDIQLFIVGLVTIVAVAVYLFIYRTNIGEKMRALAENEDIAKVSGINPLKVTMLIWFMAGVTGGLSGAFYGARSFVLYSIGWNMILVVIMIAIVGKVGSVPGAILASLGIGIVVSGVTLASNAQYGIMVLLLLFIVILKLRKGKV
jgi:branched-subunit amino acid ABC-type transport system permease component